MGRPINADAGATRARVLEVAIAHFGRDGFRAATLRKIAADAGVTFATVHHHFGTKAELFTACVAAAFEQLAAVGAELAAVLITGPAATRLERVVRAAYRAATRDRDRSRFLLRAFVFESPELSSTDSIGALRTSLLDRAVGAFAGAERDRAALRIRFVGFGMLVTRFAAASALDVDALGDALEPGGAVEDYLIEVARATLAPTLPGGHAAASPSPDTPGQPEMS